MIKWLIRWIKNLFSKKTMRRKISLYIADNIVDLDDDSFILFNYQMDDLSNPTIVKNSYSQQITLKGTPNNNKIFGHYFRTDRRIANMGGDTGADYNPSQKTPFTIYDEMGQILESGYVKLDSITRKGADIQYKISLYGGLGSFFYALSYDANGNKRTLASLDYLGTSNPDSELTFEISADAVLNAWERLTGNASRVINPLYSLTANILQDGELQYVVGGYTQKYDVSDIDDVIVSGGRNDASAFCALYDRDMNVIEVIEYGDLAATFSDYPLPIPSNAKYLLVSKYGTTNAKVEVILPKRWQVINFAPAYNGLPEGNFAPNKALVNPSEVGLLDTIIQGEGEEAVTYSTKSDYCLVNLAEAQDEWAVKDFRSYLQRPVFSMRAFLDAICKPGNNGGYEVDASIIKNDNKFGDYNNLWLTLPMLTSIGSKQQTGGMTAELASQEATAGFNIGRYNVVGSVTSGTKVVANLSCRIRFHMPSSADTYSNLSNDAHVVTQSGDLQPVVATYKFNVLFVQAVAYAADGTIVGGSNIKVVSLSEVSPMSSIADSCGYIPAWSAEYEYLDVDTYNKVSPGIFEIPQELGFSLDAQNVAYYEIHVSKYVGQKTQVISIDKPSTTFSYSGDGTSSTPVMYADYNTGFAATSAYIVQGVSGNSLTYATSASLRSGATITKAMLLSSEYTPAEYLLSFCKMFGLYFTYDNTARKVTILRRNDLYKDETIDISKRVDLSKGITIQPLVFQAKWYDFLLEGSGGAFYDEYYNLEGIPYGIQRVNTGYDFNSESVNLMDSVVFKNACTTLARSKYFNIIKDGSVFKPSPFLDKGNTYTLWSDTGETLETDISCPPSSSSVIYYNGDERYQGYDIGEARKLELHNAANKPIDGANILVFVSNLAVYRYFKVTDDIPAMDVLNDGVPCWLLGAGASGSDSLVVPIFNRYIFKNLSVINKSLDFGIPKQMDIPGVTIDEGCSIYERGWKKYISDRYDVNTKVMTCYVDFGGIQVNQDLLRKFYWFNGSLWVLNAIRNYSLTTYDPVECEFVQVQDKNDYLSGQTY